MVDEKRTGNMHENSTYHAIVRLSRLTAHPILAHKLCGAQSVVREHALTVLRSHRYHALLASTVPHSFCYSQLFMSESANIEWSWPKHSHH